jgi:two-component system, NarL family, nitrate/nitrite response regulator NarL
MKNEGEQEMGSLRILIADDHEGFREEVTQYLRYQKGVEIVGSAGNGMDAVFQARSLHPDLVLMDISMPVMSGLEAAREIKEFSPDIKVVFVTIHEEGTYQSLAKVLGVDGFICKTDLKRELPKVLAGFERDHHTASEV